MEPTIITRQDLTQLIDAWNAADRLYDLVIRLSGNSPDDNAGATIFGRILAIDHAIRNIVPLYRPPEGEDRTDREEDILTGILRSRELTGRKKAEKLLAGTDPEKTRFSLEDEVSLITAYEGIRQLETFCWEVLGKDTPEDDSILLQLYGIEDVLLRSSPINRLDPNDGTTADDNPAAKILTADLHPKEKARKLLALD